MKTLKKIVILAIMIAVSTVSANAQFRFGLKAGVNLNKLDFSNVSSNFGSDNGCGFTGGVMTEFQVPIVGLCLDASLMYTHMSAETTVETDNSTIETENKNFLEIPINLKYKFNLPVVSSFLTPYIATGPAFAFKFGGDNDVFKTKTFQCAWNVGVGIEFFSHLQITGQYAFGINNIAESIIGGTATDNIKLKNNYWTITAAYLF
jgi:hypothetical protein